MDVRFHLPLEELVRLERVEKDAAQSKRLRIVILALGGWTAPAIAMSVGLTRRICQRWVYRYNEFGLEGLNDRRGQELRPTLRSRAIITYRNGIDLPVEFLA
jgi:transposase